LYDVLDPASEDWPLFPTFHAPTLWKTGREQLDNEVKRPVDEIIESVENPLELYREYDLCPPAMTTEGARHLLKRLTAKADIQLDGEKSYLTLHGARRGVGEQYYREASPATAQRALRHANPRTTSEMYSHIEASELSAVGSSVFENEHEQRDTAEETPDQR
jgi:integrase